jgi:hypothetical protein
MVFAGGAVPPKGGTPCGRYQLIWVQSITWSDSGHFISEPKFHLRREISSKKKHFSAAKRPIYRPEKQISPRRATGHSVAMI